MSHVGARAIVGVLQLCDRHMSMHWTAVDKQYFIRVIHLSSN